MKIWIKRCSQTPRLPSTLTLLAVGWLLAAGVAVGQQDFSQVQIKVTKVAGTVYMLEGAGGNIGVSVGEDGIVLVDDQFAPLAPKIRAALKGITDKPIKFVRMLKETRALVAGAASQGKSAGQMKQEHLLAKYEELGKGFIKTEAWIDLLYAEATQKPGASPGYQNHGHADERQ